MFEDFLLKDCKILLDNPSYWNAAPSGNIVLLAQVLEVSEKLMKVRMLTDAKHIHFKNEVMMFQKDDEVYLNIRHITAISINYGKV